jgi:hypothetical protein
LVRSPEEDLIGKVPAQFATERALDRDGLEREFPDAGWNVAAAPFAGNDEGFAAYRAREHVAMIGEE